MRLHSRRATRPETNPAPTDWASGPPATVVLSCGHQVLYRPPSPAKGDLIICVRCDGPALVLKPVRRLDRHAPPLGPLDLLPAREAAKLVAALGVVGGEW